MDHTFTDILTVVAHHDLSKKHKASLKKFAGNKRSSLLASDVSTGVERFTLNPKVEGSNHGYLRERENCEETL